MTNIRIDKLTACKISDDGSSIQLGFFDASGNHTSVTICVNQAGALAMTLPKLIEKALRKQLADDSVRYTYPLGSWSLEQTGERDTRIVTLRTPDGFSVCFSIQPERQNELGEALSRTYGATGLVVIH